MKNKFHRSVFFLVIFNILSQIACIDLYLGGAHIDESGIDSSKTVTKYEWTQRMVEAYSSRYTSCGFDVFKMEENEFYTLVSLLILGSNEEYNGISFFDMEENLDDLYLSFSSSKTHYFYKDSLEYCTRTILTSPCQPNPQDQASSLYLAVIRSCLLNPGNSANFWEKRQGNW
ncbi:hypothetical protein J9305_09550 [Leptospira interrogans]|uniref:hypothetical protein n=1 Tax=Leptospira interrogans TaxID=173 RepID=UPI0002783C2A|nr:hypothetical protein [Leptospira interrogans]EJP03997.1 hypothetical protein LEP1GSC007_3068 [Leptospira interrogans serovar Bulgarica str. Mallika]UID82034.1 hypothetical protein J9305_09550 [Leptospira interrogans]